MRFSNLPVVTVIQQQREDSNPGSLTLEFIFLSTSPSHWRFHEILFVSLGIKNTLNEKVFIYHFYFLKIACNLNRNHVIQKMCLVRSEAMAFRSQAGTISRKLGFLLSLGCWRLRWGWSQDFRRRTRYMGAGNEKCGTALQCAYVYQPCNIIFVSYFIVYSI